MNLDELTIGEARQLAAMFGTQVVPQGSTTIVHGLAIVVLDRGFVYIGKVTTDREWCFIHDARNIRRWGTSSGLGELVQQGPTDKTKMDFVGLVKSPMRAVISVLPVEALPWSQLYSR